MRISCGLEYGNNVKFGCLGLIVIYSPILLVAVMDMFLIGLLSGGSRSSWDIILSVVELSRPKFLSWYCGATNTINRVAVRASCSKGDKFFFKRPESRGNTKFAEVSAPFCFRLVSSRRMIQ